MCLMLQACASTSEPAHAGNPLWDGWYADPEGLVFGDEYWIYPTFSAAYDDQVFFDAFSSPDLVTWTKHERILDTTIVAWADSAMWAPSAIQKDGRTFFFFAANDIQSDDAVGGIGVAVADDPGGPFSDYLGRPLIGTFHNGAQPIDQFVFQDGDRYYLLYGGWGHANIAQLNDDFTGLVPFEDGTTFREITPEDYVEGPVMFVRGGRYYFMWSEGGWTNETYRVAYGVADSPFGPFERVGTVLEQDPALATGAGHHSVIRVPGTDEWYAVYHRRPIPNLGRDHRVTAIDRMEFNADGTIRPIVMTTEGVAARPLR
ncbi:glycoside hydrolase family 43 protein [Rubrivirga sp.]|uniref:glycoside hydrolase family 43 protein n=1 Tax=Rubrivirga sp. TaxID=1885344 RepID=UPI003B52953F